jgi:hypothetical protein
VEGQAQQLAPREKPARAVLVWRQQGLGELQERDATFRGAFPLPEQVSAARPRKANGWVGGACCLLAMSPEPPPDLWTKPFRAALEL